MVTCRGQAATLNNIDRVYSDLGDTRQALAHYEHPAGANVVLPCASVVLPWANAVLPCANALLSGLLGSRAAGA